MTQARDVMREVLMKNSLCQRACAEVCGCDCAADTLALIAALTAAGFKIVAREPTDDMVEALRRYAGNVVEGDVWVAMWDAAE